MEINNSSFGISSDVTMATSLFALHDAVKISGDFNSDMPLYGKNALKQNTVHSPTATYVYEPLHNAAAHVSIN
jgi:hypothetical protein